MNDQAFIRDLALVINQHSRENASNTPDYVLAEYLFHCLLSYEAAIKARRDHSILNPANPDYDGFVFSTNPCSEIDLP